MYSVNNDVRTQQVGKLTFKTTRRRWVGFASVLTIALVLFLLLAIAPAFALGAMRPGFDTNALAGNDDSSTGLVPIGFPVEYFGTTYNNLYVNNNGNVTFDAALSTFTPFNLSSTSRVIIAPFFADVDTRTGNIVRYGNGTVGGRNAFGVTWPGVYCYNTNSTAGQDYFQMILIDRSDTGPGNFDIEFNYDQIDWETGQASGGNVLCEGGSAARVGFSNGGTFNFELPGSGISGSFLDTNQVTGLVHNLLNSNTFGRYVWSVRSSVIVVNQDPVVAADQDSVTVDEGQNAANTGTVTDGDGDVVALVASVGSVVNNNDDTWSWSFGTSDGPAESQTVTISADDGNGGLAEVEFELIVDNVSPTALTLSPTVPDPVVEIGTNVDFEATFSDPASVADEDYYCGFDWDDDGTVDANVPADYGTCSSTASYGMAGVYKVSLTVTDKDDGVSNEIYYQYVVVYDPDGGFVTGGGWIDSPSGAYTPENLDDDDVTGKASFGFVSKYKKGANVPTGNTQFQFKAGDLNFHSNDYDWLVVAGHKAQYKGTGTINNGDGEYKFMLSAVDANKTNSTDIDRFRIKIWDKVSGVVIYDNQVGSADDAEASTDIGGGSIVIHTRN